MNFVCNLIFADCDKDFAIKVEKACEIVNKCCGYQLLHTNEVRHMVLGSMGVSFS